MKLEITESSHMVVAGPLTLGLAAHRMGRKK